jgi:hypothetical protein
MVENRGGMAVIPRTVKVVYGLPLTAPILLITMVHLSVILPSMTVMRMSIMIQSVIG